MRFRSNDSFLECIRELRMTADELKLHSSEKEKRLMNEVLQLMPTLEDRGEPEKTKKAKKKYEELSSQLEAGEFLPKFDWLRRRFFNEKNDSGEYTTTIYFYSENKKKGEKKLVIIDEDLHSLFMDRFRENCNKSRDRTTEVQIFNLTKRQLGGEHYLRMESFELLKLPDDRSESITFQNVAQPQSVRQTEAAAAPAARRQEQATPMTDTPRGHQQGNAALPGALDSQPPPPPPPQQQ